MLIQIPAIQFILVAALMLVEAGTGIAMEQLKKNLVIVCIVLHAAAAALALFAAVQKALPRPIVMLQGPAVKLLVIKDVLLDNILPTLAVIL